MTTTCETKTELIDKPKNDTGKKLDRIVYKTTNLINGKIYIGKDKYNNPKYLGSGKNIRRAIKNMANRIL